MSVSRRIASIAAALVLGVAGFSAVGAVPEFGAGTAYQADGSGAGWDSVQATDGGAGWDTPLASTGDGAGWDTVQASAGDGAGWDTVQASTGDGAGWDAPAQDAIVQV
ncbi:hypothetical protein [Streptomyces ochraceiscleroticus]|uniref:Uncharacterized protein n=1 Tax=Streptomyces ochraceiscleroticus TaxID=47761 RepID=A0ABW1MK93_9ACTN|nr:hypothetical protein [Streptomyces ochraceiscleroticus]